MIFAKKDDFIISANRGVCRKIHELSAELYRALLTDLPC